MAAVMAAWRRAARQGRKKTAPIGHAGGDASVAGEPGTAFAVNGWTSSGHSVKRIDMAIRL